MNRLLSTVGRILPGSNIFQTLIISCILPVIFSVYLSTACASRKKTEPKTNGPSGGTATATKKVETTATASADKKAQPAPGPAAAAGAGNKPTSPTNNAAPAPNPAATSPTGAAKPPQVAADNNNNKVDPSKSTVPLPSAAPQTAVAGGAAAQNVVSIADPNSNVTNNTQATNVTDKQGAKPVTGHSAEVDKTKQSTVVKPSEAGKPSEGKRKGKTLKKKVISSNPDQPPKYAPEMDVDEDEETLQNVKSLEKDPEPSQNDEKK